jgi:hypothetical protein
MFVLCTAIGLGASLSLQAEQVLVTPGEGGGQPGYFVRFESTVLKGQPYSAETVRETIQTLSDGNRIVQRTTGRVYRDVEGRVRREDDRPSGAPTISISDPVAKLSWTLNPDTRTARETTGVSASLFSEFMVTLKNRLRTAEPSTTVPKLGVITGGGGRGAGGARGGSIEPPNTLKAAPRSGVGGRGAGPGYEQAEEQLPNKSIENLLCTGVRRTTTIPKGAIGNEQPIKIVSEEWTSIDLQVLVLTDLNDPRSGRSTYKLLNVRRSDPDLTLFRVPSDYTITRTPGGRGRGGH